MSHADKNDRWFRFGLWTGCGLLVAFLTLPLASLVLSVRPATLLAQLRQPPVLDALKLSLITSIAASGIVVLLGLPTAYWLATRDFRGKRFVETLVYLPMVLPPTVAGFALLLAFGRAGLTGDALAFVGLRLPFSTLGVVVAQVFMSAPFFVAPTRAAFLSLDPKYTQTAATLRSSEAYTFWRVVLGKSVRRVRGHHNVCRQHAGSHTDHATGRLHGVAKRFRWCHRTVTRLGGCIYQSSACLAVHIQRPFWANDDTCYTLRSVRGVASSTSTWTSPLNHDILSLW